MRTPVFFAIVTLACILQACRTKQPVVVEEVTEDTIEVASVDVIWDSSEGAQNIWPDKIKDYRASRTRQHDLVHTKLDIRFDWAQKQVLGKAWVTLKPHFYACDSVVLDAKQFEIHSITLMPAGKELAFTYNDEQVFIKLDKAYKKDEAFTVYLEYTASPRKTSNGIAITSDNGLYFINADSNSPLAPRQLWTQGETESSSKWFPTIDSPNQLSTEEIYITVPREYVTLSNGTMVNTLLNNDGTRTDYWRQDKPHAPYLFMVAAGEFAVVKEYWRDMEVNYYVEPSFKNDAKAIFANTPEMIDFFSKRLGVDYPWDKYSQIIVKDFVSGAMENTSAVVFGDFVQQSAREIIDDNYEDIVAHELFHHWFGDLVVCESWSNTPLNESFATYGEYLWFEYKYGKDFADYHLDIDLESYFREAAWGQKDLIRFYYRERDDMFDNHSYQKGGRVLHLLRNYVGDDAFFASLKYYLTKHAHSSVEIHDLRLAFEEVTGQDLNWFFNQWFLGKGHPVLEVSTAYDEQKGTCSVSIVQNQAADLPTFRLPLNVDIYLKDTVLRMPVVMDQRTQTFEFSVPEKPLCISPDGDRVLLGTIRQERTENEYIVLFNRSQNVMDRFDALMVIRFPPVIKKALDDPSPSVRRLALSGIDPASPGVVGKLKHMAGTDPSAYVREKALVKLGEMADESLLRGILHADSSIAVMSEALDILSYKAEERTVPDALFLLHDEYLFQGAIEILIRYPDSSYVDSIKQVWPTMTREGKQADFMRLVPSFLLAVSPEAAIAEVPFFVEQARSHPQRRYAYESLLMFLESFHELLDEQQRLLDQNDPAYNAALHTLLTNEIPKLQAQKDTLRKNEKDSFLIEWYDTLAIYYQF